METLEIKKENALKAYNNGCGDVKKVLSNLFGAETFIPKKTWDQIKTFQDACNAIGVDSTKIVTGYETTDELAYIKLKAIAKALNEGWVPDWSNSNQYKYYPWFDMSSGSGLSCNGYAYQYSNSHVGSRLCFKSRELAEYAGKQFLDIYKDFFLI